MAAIVIPLAPVIAGVVAGVVTHFWRLSAGTAGVAPLSVFLPIPIIAAALVGVYISHLLNPANPSPKLLLSGQPLHGPSAVWGTIISAVLQFTVQVVWPLLESMFFPGPVVPVPAPGPSL